MGFLCCKKPEVILDLPPPPKHSILKNSREQASPQPEPKEATFDEQNIRETFHPADKDYGHQGSVINPRIPGISGIGTGIWDLFSKSRIWDSFPKSAIGIRD